MLECHRAPCSQAERAIATAVRPRRGVGVAGLPGGAIGSRRASPHFETPRQAAGGIPAHGNQRSSRDSGCCFDPANPRYSQGLAGTQALAEDMKLTEKLGQLHVKI